MSSINVNSFLSFLQDQLGGRDALITAFGSYVASVSAPALAPLATPAKSAKDSSPSAPAEPPAAPKKAKKVKAEAPESAEPKPKREPNDWIKFTSRVRSVLAPLQPEGKKLPPVAVTQTSSALKDAGLMPSATDDQIRAAYAEWQANPPAVGKWKTAHPEDKPKKSKKSKASDASSASTTSTKPSVAKALDFSAPTSVPAPPAEGKKRQGRKKLADMTAEERAAHDAKKAAKRASKTPPLPSSPKASAEDELLDFTAFTWSGLSLLKNPRGDCLTEDMEWFGKWDPVTQKVNTEAAQPSDLNL